MSLMDALLLDPYPVHVWVAIRSDSVAGTGTVTDPLSANSAADFDRIMNGLEPNTVVHLGPGTFHTRGYSDSEDADYGWQVKAGIRIIGSGIDVTTLQLNVDSTENAQFYAVGHPLTTGSDAPNPMALAAISDLTIDGNVSGQTSGDQAQCGAIRLMGDHVRVSRVKVINWGVRVTGQACYAICLVTADPASGLGGLTDAGVEDCIVLGPDPYGPTVAIHAGPKEGVTPRAEAYGKGPFIRRCFVDFATFDPVTVDTTYDHRAFSMGWCLGGVIEGNQAYNVKNGALLCPLGSVRDMVLRDNFFKNVYKGVLFQAGLADIVDGSVSRSGTDATVSSTGHHLAVGDRVVITHKSGQSAAFDGIHEITEVEDDSFKFKTSSSSTATPNVTVGKVYGAGRVLLEGNEIELATETTGELIAMQLDDAGMAQDAEYPAYAHGDAVVRGNRLRYVDGQFESDYVGSGTKASGVGRLTVSDQVLELAPKHLLQDSDCGSATYNNNRTPDGLLVQGENSDLSYHKYDEPVTRAEDAFVLAFMSRR